MNREIKFRAWDKDEGKMLNDICTNTDDFTDMLNETFKYWQNPELNNLVLMQYTGLKDKNGKEIYEGDVVEFDCINEKGEERTERCVVVWGKYDYQLIDKNDGNAPIYAIGEDVIEVIGNIYSNPDLLNHE